MGAKKKVKLILAISALMLVFIFPAELQANQVVQYETPMKVKLIPSINFNVNPTGQYRLFNLDNQREVAFSGEIQFRHAANQVTVRVNGRDFTSNRGFEFQELRTSTESFMTISSIQQKGDFQTYQYRGSLRVEPGPDRLTLFNTLDIEDYLLGVVPSEMPASWHQEALKAQAVAARNYAFKQMAANGFLVDTVANQVYGGKSGEHSDTNQAVRATKGIYATHNGVIIDAYFHSSSGGFTENSENVWRNPVPYIRAVHDPYDRHASNSNNSWNTQLNRSTMEQTIFGNGVRLVNLRVTERSAPAGSVQKLTATGINTSTGAVVTTTLPKNNGTGDSLRSAFGSPSLRSINFTIDQPNVAVKVKTANGGSQNMNYTYGAKVQSANGSQSIVNTNELTVQMKSSTIKHPTAANTYTFNGSGWGHRLGMSQWGARGMAEAGKKYDEILKHYYTGIQIERR
jgi:stage II sporulation protein D